MKDINNFIDETVERTGEPEELVEKVLRSMFKDVQKFTSHKKGVNIQIPHLGTFLFRAHSIPSYINSEKGTLSHWISRLLIGEAKLLNKTIYAANSNIKGCFYKLKQVGLIKKEYIEKHARYRPKTKAHLIADSDSDLESLDDYIKTIKLNLLPGKDHEVSEDDLL